MSIKSAIHDKLGITARREEEQRQRALAGLTTSGYLRPGDRDRAFREAKVQPRPRRFMREPRVHASNQPAKRRWWK